MHSQEVKVVSQEDYDRMLEVARQLSVNDDKNNPYIQSLNAMRKRQLERE